jgi:hypothetical protein
MYSRIEKRLPTHGSNTTAYAEVSMKATKETQFGLPELLEVICDNSAMYKDKLIDIGNSRWDVLKNAKSKYLGPECNLTKNQIVDFSNGMFNVQSEKNEDVWYICNMKTGQCSCPRGINFAPCKHKGAVAKHFNTAEFSVTPNDDPCQCALYHFIAIGSTLPAHAYRKKK